VQLGDEPTGPTHEASAGELGAAGAVPGGGRELDLDQLGEGVFEAAHAKQARPDEQLERDERADRVAGKADHRQRAGVTEHQRLARLDRHLVEPDVEAGRTQGVPDEVVLADRDTTEREQDIGLHAVAHACSQLGGLVARDREHERLAARIGHRGREAVRVRVHDRARQRRLPELAQLVAGRQDRHPRPAVHAHCRAVERREQAELTRADQGAACERERACGEIRARTSHVGARCRELADLNRVADSLAVLLDHHGVRAFWQPAAGEDAQRAGRLEPQRLARLRARLAANREHDAARELGVPDRVAVHRAVVEARQARARAGVLREHAAVRSQKQQFFVAPRREPRPHRFECLTNAEHGWSPGSTTRHGGGCTRARTSDCSASRFTVDAQAHAGALGHVRARGDAVRRHEHR
jgi:hypothetical protein